MRSMVEGHRRVLLTFWRGDSLNVPLHHPADGPPPRAGEELVNPAFVLISASAKLPSPPLGGEGPGERGQSDALFAKDDKEEITSPRP